MKNLIKVAFAFALAATAAHADPASEPTLKQAIADAIGKRVPAPGRYEVILSTPDDALGETLPRGNGQRLERLNFNPANQTFQATFVYRNDLGNEERITLAGSAYPVIGVPTLLQDFAMGDTVTAASLSTIEVPANRAQASMITAPDMIMGQVARRPIRANTPLFTVDFTKPVAVKKGDTITIIAEMPGIRLSTQGKAMSSGGKGDIVTFMNTSSRRQVDARIVDAGTAVIVTSTRTASIN